MGLQDLGSEASNTVQLSGPADQNRAGRHRIVETNPSQTAAHPLQCVGQAVLDRLGKRLDRNRRALVTVEGGNVNRAILVAAIADRLAVAQLDLLGGREGGSQAG